MRKSVLTSLITAAGLAIASASFAGSYTGDENYTASAADSVSNGWYVGVGVNHDSRGDTNSTVSYDYSDGDYGFNLLAGKQLNDYLAAEVEYQMVGDASANGSNGTLVQNMKNAYYLNLMGVGSYPVMGGVSIYGKAGISYFYGEYTEDLNSAQVYDNKQGVTNFAVGGGLRYDHNDKFGVRLDYMQVLDKNDDAQTPIKDGYMPNLLSLDFLYNFG